MINVDIEPNVTDLSIEEMYRQLAIIDAGVGSKLSSVTISAKSFDYLASDSSNIGDFLEKLAISGKAIFDKNWPAIKSYVCAVYGQNGQDGPLKDWVQSVVSAIVAGLGISGNVAAALVLIAVKLGLDSLCAV
jgi:hypothetical protein